MLVFDSLAQFSFRAIQIKLSLHRKCVIYMCISLPEEFLLTPANVRELNITVNRLIRSNLKLLSFRNVFYSKFCACFQVNGVQTRCLIEGSVILV